MLEAPKELKLDFQLWGTLRLQAEKLQNTAPALSASLNNAVLRRASFADALANVLADAMRNSIPQDSDVKSIFCELVEAHPEIAQSAAADLQKLDSVNPACPDLLTGFMSFRGFQGLQFYRITHALWNSGERQLASMLQNWGALKFAMDIHPAAKIGKAVFFDHGMGIVIGSTSVIEDGVNMWHGVTLGSTLTEAGDRHPKVRRDATICAGATILGNIEIGEGAIVAAASVVLKTVPAGAVVAGVPARVVGRAPDRLSAIDKEFKSTSTQAQES